MLTKKLVWDMTNPACVANMIDVISALFASYPVSESVVMVQMVDILIVYMTQDAYDYMSQVLRPTGCKMYDFKNVPSHTIKII